MARSNKTASTTAADTAIAAAEVAVAAANAAVAAENAVAAETKPAPVTITIPPAVARTAPRDAEERNKMIGVGIIAGLIGIAIGS